MGIGTFGWRGVRSAMHFKCFPFIVYVAFCLFAFQLTCTRVFVKEVVVQTTSCDMHHHKTPTTDPLIHSLGNLFNDLVNDNIQCIFGIGNSTFR